MAVDNGTDLIAALARFEPELLVGTHEGQRIEFKRPAAYKLEHDSGKWELAKDVAAMANVEGGLIVIGVATMKDPAIAGDVAYTVDPCKSPHNLVQVKSVLSSWLFPPPNVGLTVFPVAAGSSEHLLVITVDPVLERDRYVMIRKTEMDNGKYRNAVAVPLRVGDDTRWLSAEELYRLLNDGFRGRRDGFARSPMAAAGAARAPEKARERANSALARLESGQGWEDEPVLFWQSYVDPAADPMPGLFSTDGIGAFLDGPNGLRSGGFHFHNPYVRIQATATGLLLPSRDGMAVHLGLDGTVTAGVVANRRLLARSQEWSEGLPVSAIVLTELTYEFFRLADEHVAPLTDGVWRHRLVARRMKRKEVTLRPGGTGQAGRGRPMPALADEWDKEWVGAGDAAQDAGKALSVFYNLFGLDATDANPWVTGGRVDVDAFVKEMSTASSPAPG
jgi:Putative DNA-binding domain